MAKKKKSKEKSPFKGFTIEDVFEAEATYFVIQIGDDFFTYDEKMAFGKQQATKYYNKILKELGELYEDGNFYERRDVALTLLSLKVTPLRIH